MTKSKFDYRRPNPKQEAYYATIRNAAKQMADVLDACCPESRERSLAHTNFEQAIMWANRSVALYVEE